MNHKQIFIFLVAILTVSACFAQQSPVADDWKPSSLNQLGQEYPQVNSQGYARFRINAPQAQSVSVSLGRLSLTKDENGVWTGTTAQPQDPGFHYYTITIDGASVTDPGTNTFYGSSRLQSGIEIPAPDEEFYAEKMSRTEKFAQNIIMSKVPANNVTHISILLRDMIKIQPLVILYFTYNMVWAKTEQPGLSRAVQVSFSTISLLKEKPNP